MRWGVRGVIGDRILSGHYSTADTFDADLTGLFRNVQVLTTGREGVVGGVRGEG